MEKYLSVAEMIAVEKASDAIGHTYPMMMAHAGRSLAEVVLQTQMSSVLGLIGKGNNGGDALVAMADLLDAGWRAVAYLTAQRENDPLLDEFVAKGGQVKIHNADVNFQDELVSQIVKGEVLLDGLLGTGIKLPLRPPVPEILAVIKKYLEESEHPPIVIAVDCPSGVDCDTGEVPEDCLEADITVCMAAVKQGLLMLPAYKYLGDLIVGNIGVSPYLREWQQINRYVLDQDFIETVLPERGLDSHKGTFGTALVVAGSRNYAGAALLAGKAAFRSGAGWVKIAIPELLHPYLVSSFIEATWVPLPGNQWGFCEKDAAILHQSMDKETAVLLGPGFGQTDDVTAFVHAFVKPDLPPTVVDADGLKLLSKLDHWWDHLPPHTILTPHPGEMSIITGLPVSDIQADRVAAAEHYAREWNHIVVLKGAFTVIAEPDGKTAILPVATPALARAGTGDVLAGIITGLLAQKMVPFDAAAAGVWLHAQAGLAAAEERGSTAGVLAGDLIEILPELLIY